jgi:uncharacterized protein YjbJ (UPF0337 family)
MNKDQMKGAAKQVEGKLQKGAGNLQQAAEDADRKSQQTAEDIDRKSRP